MSAASELDVAVRDVTDKDVETFWSHGWLLVRELIPSAVALQMAARVQKRMGIVDGDVSTATEQYWVAQRRALHYKGVSRDDDLFRAVATAPALGRNIARLMRRNGPIRLYGDGIMVKLGTGSAEGGPPAPYFQDWYPGRSPVDRMPLLGFFILDDVAPEHAPIEFFRGSHRLGPLGELLPDNMARWPALMECPLDRPTGLRPGDVIFRHCLTVHGTTWPPGDRARWASVCSFTTGDALYTGTEFASVAGLGLEPYKTIDHPNTPIVYTPDA